MAYDRPTELLLHQIAQSLDQLFNETIGEVGFCLVLFPRDAEENGAYVSNKPIEVTEQALHLFADVLTELIKNSGNSNIH